MRVDVSRIPPREIMSPSPLCNTRFQGTLRRIASDVIGILPLTRNSKRACRSKVYPGERLKIAPRERLRQSHRLVYYNSDSSRSRRILFDATPLPCRAAEGTQTGR